MNSHVKNATDFAFDNKVSEMQDEIASALQYKIINALEQERIEAARELMGVQESVEDIDEKLTGDMPASKIIHDFVHSDNPKFKGKSKKERVKMALGAFYGMHKEEESETVEEKYEGFKKLEGELEAKDSKNPAGLAAWIGRKKYGKKKFQKAAATDHKMG